MPTATLERNPVTEEEQGESGEQRRETEASQEAQKMIRSLEHIKALQMKVDTGKATQEQEKLLGEVRVKVAEILGRDPMLLEKIKQELGMSKESEKEAETLGEGEKSREAMVAKKQDAQKKEAPGLKKETATVKKSEAVHAKDIWKKFNKANKEGLPRSFTARVDDRISAIETAFDEVLRAKDRPAANKIFGTLRSGLLVEVKKLPPGQQERAQQFIQDIVLDEAERLVTSIPEKGAIEDGLKLLKQQGSYKDFRIRFNDDLKQGKWHDAQQSMERQISFLKKQELGVPEESYEAMKNEFNDDIALALKGFSERKQELRARVAAARKKSLAA